MQPKQIITEVTNLQPIIIEAGKTLIVNSPEKETIYIGSQGPQGPGGAIGELQFNTLVAPTEIGTLDSVNIGLVDSVIWEVTVVDRLLGIKRVTTIRGLQSEGAAAHMIGPYFGASQLILNHVFDVTLLAGELILTVENLHSNPITAEVLRIKTNRIDF